MAAFVDFAVLKERVTIEQVLEMLQIQVRRQGAQLRAPCPACKTGGDRALVVTPAKSLFYCFAARQGGDQIALAAHVNGCKINEAAALIWRNFGTVQVPVSRNSTVPGNSTSTVVSGSLNAGEKRLQPLTYLEALHPTVQALGVSAATCEAFEAGYAGKGIMRGRLAVPVKAKDGTLLAYVGIAVDREQSPQNLLPSNFDGSTALLGADRMQAGPLFLVRSPLDLLLAFENGVENVVSFLAEIGPQQLEILAAVMDEAKCETVELF